MPFVRILLELVGRFGFLTFLAALHHLAHHVAGAAAAGLAVPPNWACADPEATASARSKPPDTSSPLSENRSPERIGPTFDNSMSSRLSAKSSVKVASIASGTFLSSRSRRCESRAGIISRLSRQGPRPSQAGGLLCAPGDDAHHPKYEANSSAEDPDTAEPAVPVRPLPEGMRVPSYSPGPMPYHPGSSSFTRLMDRNSGGERQGRPECKRSDPTV